MNHHISTREVILDIQNKFNATLQSKTGWGRNEIEAALQKAITEAALDALDAAPPQPQPLHLPMTVSSIDARLTATLDGLGIPDVGNQPIVRTIDALKAMDRALTQIQRLLAPVAIEARDYDTKLSIREGINKSIAATKGPYECR